MLAGWSLRTRLVVVVTIALLPVLALAAWYAVREQRGNELRRTEMVGAAAELVVARQGELLEATRRLLMAMCEEDTVRLSARPDAPAADINRCEAYLGQVLQKFASEYSSAVVTEAAVTARCARAPPPNVRPPPSPTRPARPAAPARRPPSAWDSPTARSSGWCARARNSP